MQGFESISNGVRKSFDEEDRPKKKKKKHKAKKAKSALKDYYSE